MDRLNPPAEQSPIFEREEPFPLLEYLQVLWFRRRLIIAVALFAAVIGLIHVNELRNVYSASSSLMIGVPQVRVVNIDQVLSRDLASNAAEAEMEVLRSRGLAQSVIERLELLNQAEFNPELAAPQTSFFDFTRYLDPRRWIPGSWKQFVREIISGEVEPTPNAGAPPLPGTATMTPEEQKAHQTMVRAVNIFLSKLGVSRVGYTNVVVIRFSSLDPELAARVANEIPEAYIDDQLQAKFEATRKATEWLTKQLEEQQQKVAESERAVVIFREAAGLTEGSGNEFANQQVTELNSELIVARAQRMDLESRLSQVNLLLANDLAGIETSVEIMASPVVQQLRGEQADARRGVDELALVYGPKHPRMLQANAAMAGIEGRIRTQVESIALNLANELEQTRNKIANLQRRLSDAEAQTGQQNREAIQLRLLEREAAANRALFETFLNRFKETSSTEELQTSDARVISAAVVPGGPSYPDRQRIFLMFLAGGLLAGCALVFSLHALHQGMLTPEEIEHVLGVHNLGVIPLQKGKEHLYEQLVKQKSSPYIEAFNSLKTSLQLSDPDGKVKVLHVTSSLPGEGKSSTATSLAITLARSGQKVVLIDGDLRQAGIEKRLGVDVDTPGLTDLLITPDGEVDSFISHLDPFGIDFMRSGHLRHANASDLFSSRRMRDIVGQLRQKYDYVLLDSPPAMSFADARIIGQLADRTLFVVHWDKTPRKVAKAAIDVLRKSGIVLVGSVLQQVNLGRYGRLGYGNSGYYYHYGRYGRYYQD